jgi:hypothetical protein
MASDHKDSVRRFARLARHRIDGAAFILAASVSRDDTPAIAGKLTVENANMAVECILKALILASTPIGQREEAEKSFRGTRAHDQEWLRGKLIVRGVNLPRKIVQSLSRLNWWSYERRYDAESIPLNHATTYLSAVRLILEWAERSL